MRSRAARVRTSTAHPRADLESEAGAATAGPPGGALLGALAAGGAPPAAPPGDAADHPGARAGGVLPPPVQAALPPSATPKSPLGPGHLHRMPRRSFQPVAPPQLLQQLHPRGNEGSSSGAAQTDHCHFGLLTATACPACQPIIYSLSSFALNNLKMRVLIQMHLGSASVVSLMQCTWEHDCIGDFSISHRSSRVKRRRGQDAL